MTIFSLCFEWIDDATVGWLTGGGICICTLDLALISNLISESSPLFGIVSCDDVFLFSRFSLFASFCVVSSVVETKECFFEIRIVQDAGGKGGYQLENYQFSYDH